MLPRKSRLCPICGGSGTQIYFNEMAPIGGIDMSYSVNECVVCSSVFADNLPSEEDYTAYYSTFSKYDLAPTGAASDTARIHESLADMIMHHVPAESAILDIGCGCGHLLYCLKKRGATRLSGLDPAPNARELAAMHYGLEDVRQGFISKSGAGLGRNTFDVICFSAVLEHLSDVFGALETSLAATKPGGWLAIEVPDVDAFDGVHCEPYGELSLEHINYFSQQSMRLLLEQLGCHIVADRRLQHEIGGSLLVLARKENVLTGNRITNDSVVMKKYLQQSEDTFRPLLHRTVEQLHTPYMIYGAGSHTARLLPHLEHRGVLENCIGIVDNNKNLQGHSMGGIPIYPSSTLTLCVPCSVLISSFKAEQSIAKSLASERHAVVLFYNNA